MPILVGTAWGRAQSGTLDVTIALIALLATAAVQAGTNVINDVGDEIGGTDRANVDRIFPYSGGSRFIQNGVMSLTEMKRWGVALVAGAMLLGALLAWMKGPVVVGIGLAGIALGMAYSLPPLHLAARSVSEDRGGPRPRLHAGHGSPAWLQSGRLDGAAALVAVPTTCRSAPSCSSTKCPTSRRMPAPASAPAGAHRHRHAHRVRGHASDRACRRRGLGQVLGHLHWGRCCCRSRSRGSASPRRRASAATRPGARRSEASMERTLMMHTVGSVWIAAWAWFAH
ncbi:MAG: prenyltransferase [Steroidobacteraceae bacterium]